MGSLVKPKTRTAANNSRRVPMALALIAALLVTTLTACGGASVKNLQETCDTLRSEMIPFDDIGLLDRKLYYDGESVAMLLGNESRSSNKAFIYRSFPFMKGYTIEGIKRGDYKKGINNFKVQTAIQLFASTANPIVLTEKEKGALEAAKDPYKEVIEPKVIRVIGESYSEDGCVGLDTKNNVDFTKLVDGLYEETQNAAKESVSHLLGILLCERDGKIGDKKCDTKDFKDTYVPSNKPTAEELAILEERRQTAEREALNPSTPTVNSNVTPMQGCSSLGAVVQTENYGELTCKLLWVNRIKALVWMRS